ncbi:glutamine--fructose-6-phosphate transaminase (isomerizing) [Rubrobacter tropicus]|uniref:Glutamine--fructose-6-phosphate aminotransferase [isomerizing] n=1 Tax=Rubrobacter tropicus TaxID=2653851 RepID=A0A6G8Q777_9ACTN|nr:glutamine--fructose-6-phosphate transaminase (isomerizing) [Rubrobacter tropicus]QIN82288.1 glutamine--fructose-6-phosphate transaminase (isomerizing) [Rubrobacter tropicus]
MCGIVGYVGRERCVEVLMQGLSHLEYRGYDSAGLALQGEGGIEPIREVGRLENLGRAVAARNGHLSRMRAGIGHTRWATHGRPSEQNAHPQMGGRGTVAVVHNGIIENFAELKAELLEKGVRFESETDTEVMAHLLAERVEANPKETLRASLSAVLGRLEGSFAVAAVSVAEPGVIVAARHQSPLVVGLGEGENFLASAVQALLGETRRFLVVENGEVVEITGDSVGIFTRDGGPVERESFEVDWDAEAVELGVYEDFMMKEIHEQPEALRATLAGRLDAEGRVDLSETGLDLRHVNRVVVVACGTALHAGLLGKGLIERLARLPVEVAVASEYRYADPVGDENTLVVAISQSGETTDTLAAVEAARYFGGKVLAVTNTRGSLITREADAVLLTEAGPEICVASTKAFAAQVAALDLLALELARVRGTVSDDELLSLGRDLRRAPEKVAAALALLEGKTEAAVELFEDARCSLFLGRGPAFPVALEGALKLKEISYIPSEGYAAGEMKHGPIALVDEQCPVVAILGEGVLREKTLSNVEETAARGANVVAIAREDDAAADRVGRVVLCVPDAPEILRPLVWSVPLQLLAHDIATDRGLDVDKPRNLAKSVTVE